MNGCKRQSSRRPRDIGAFQSSAPNDDKPVLTLVSLYSYEYTRSLTFKRARLHAHAHFKPHWRRPQRLQWCLHLGGRARHSETATAATNNERTAAGDNRSVLHLHLQA